MSGHCNKVLRSIINGIDSTRSPGLFLNVKLCAKKRRDSASVGGGSHCGPKSHTCQAATQREHLTLFPPMPSEMPESQLSLPEDEPIEGDDPEGGGDGGGGEGEDGLGVPAAEGHQDFGEGDDLLHLPLLRCSLLYSLLFSTFSLFFCVKYTRGFCICLLI